MEKSLESALVDVLKQFPQYKRGAYALVFDGLRYFQEHSAVVRHVSAHELYEAMAYASVEIWGYLGGIVTEHLGIKSAQDVKFLVSTMIGVQLLYPSEDDKMEDFDPIKMSFQTLIDAIFDEVLKNNPPSICEKHEHEI